MTRKEAILLSAYTGFLLVPDFPEVKKFCEDALGMPIWTHEFADKDVQKEVQEKLRPQIMELIQNTSALTPPTQKQMERVWGAEWVISGQCDHKPSRMRNPDKWVKFSCSKCGYSAGRKSNLKFCPSCGRAMTLEAWEEMRKRWEALYENT